MNPASTDDFRKPGGGEGRGKAPGPPATDASLARTTAIRQPKRSRLRAARQARRR